MMPDSTYSAKIISIRSLDEMVAMVDLGHDGLYKKTKLRLYGVMAPTSGALTQKDNAVMSKIVDQLLNKECTITVRYRRGSSWIVVIFDDEKRNINDNLISMGYKITTLSTVE